MSKEKETNIIVEEGYTLEETELTMEELKILVQQRNVARNTETREIEDEE